VDFLAGAAAGDLGRSLRTNQPVVSDIWERMPATFELAFAAMLVAALIAIPLGIAAGAKAGSGIDHAATTLALVGISMPTFWLGPLLAIVFSVTLGWLPVSGRGTLAHLVLPAVTLGAPLAAVLARMTRASLIEELRELYVLAARARGVSRLRAILRHAFRNSLIPIVTVMGLQFGVVLTGAVITETIFAWPGVGRLLIQSISARDYPTVQGCILLIAVTYVSMNLLVDLVYGFLDPRIRYE
jgi:peptide/nickel transport system permease protein/oligopeptide transport system permease protein